MKMYCSDKIRLARVARQGGSPSPGRSGGIDHIANMVPGPAAAQPDT